MTRKEKQTSAPLPSDKHIKKRAAALRDNLAKRKQQTRAREQQEKE